MIPLVCFMANERFTSIDGSGRCNRKVLTLKPLSVACVGGGGEPYQASCASLERRSRLSRGWLLVLGAGLSACGGASSQDAAPKLLEVGLTDPDELALWEGERALGLSSPSAEAAPTDAVAPPLPMASAGQAPQPLAANCETACEALGSMQKAAAHICELDQGSRCERAQARVARARNHVESSCGECI